mgnify:CR=1 FL=1
MHAPDLHVKTAVKMTYAATTSTYSENLSEILNQANGHMQREEYDEAVTAFKAASEKLLHYEHKLRQAIDKTIHTMALPGCAATPPMPQARYMIALRNRL